jgi:hypothetical protein
MRANQFAFLFAGSVIVAGCQNSSNTDIPQQLKFDVNKYAINQTVCNPMGGSGPSNEPTQGLHANLWYVQSGHPIYHDVEGMINHGYASNNHLFFSELFIPTRLFTEGFPLQSGGSIKDDSNQELIEYFALRFEGLLHLGPNEEEGDYQLGILSDDGTVWSLSQTETGTDYSIILNNDGDHPTQMGCGPIVHMAHSTRLHMKLDYYQGPRYHIALVPMWRKVNSCAPTEPLCGQNGNSLYFDYNNNSRPQPAFNQLLSRGWYPLGVANYSVTADTGYNPCTSGTTPVISNIQLVNNMEIGPYFQINWNTDIPATDQVLYKDLTNGAEVLTVSDNMLRTSHSVQITIVPQHQYSVQAISVSADLGKAISDPVTFTAH